MTTLLWRILGLFVYLFQGAVVRYIKVVTESLGLALCSERQLLSQNMIDYMMYGFHWYLNTITYDFFLIFFFF